jgi:transposase
MPRRAASTGAKSCETEISLPTVRLWMAEDVLPPERRGYGREGKVDPYGPYLQRRLAEGCANQTLLWQEITAQGFVGTRSLVATWVRAHRDGLPAAASASGPTLPGAQHLAWLILRAADGRDLTEDDRTLWEYLRQHDGLAWMQGMAARFAAMVRGRQVDAFDPWVADCRAGPIPELHNFATSPERDGVAVRAALALPWSNGPTEEHINKLNRCSSVPPSAG